MKCPSYVTPHSHCPPYCNRIQKTGRIQALFFLTLLVSKTCPCTPPPCHTRAHSLLATVSLHSIIYKTSRSYPAPVKASRQHPKYQLISTRHWPSSKNTNTMHPRGVIFKHQILRSPESSRSSRDSKQYKQRVCPHHDLSREPRRIPTPSSFPSTPPKLDARLPRTCTRASTSTRTRIPTEPLPKTPPRADGAPKTRKGPCENLPLDWHREEEDDDCEREGYRGAANGTRAS